VIQTEDNHSATEVISSGAVWRALVSRTSAGQLVEPGPSAEVLGRCLAAASNAPDHGKLRPWRFIIVSGPGRERFGDLLGRGLRSRNPAATSAEIEGEKQKPMRAPMIIVVAAAIHPTNKKIPAVEQILSAGVALHNIALVLQAEGFGSVWKTGAPAYDDVVKSGLGLTSADAIVGFLYVGTRSQQAPSRNPGFASEKVEYWTA